MYDSLKELEIEYGHQIMCLKEELEETKNFNKELLAQIKYYEEKNEELTNRVRNLNTLVDSLEESNISATKNLEELKEDYKNMEQWYRSKRND